MQLRQKLKRIQLLHFFAPKVTKEYIVTLCYQYQGGRNQLDKIENISAQTLLIHKFMIPAYVLCPTRNHNPFGSDEAISGPLGLILKFGILQIR